MAIQVKYSFVDEAKKTASTQINLPTGTTAANAAYAAQQGALLIDAITSSKITGISISLPVSLPAGLKSTPIDGSRVGTGILLQFRTVLNNVTKLIIPARREETILDDTDVADETHTGVANFIAEMTAGLDLTDAGGTGTVTPVDTRNEDVNAFEDGYETHNGKRRK